MHILAKCKNCKIDPFVVIMPNNVNTEWIFEGGEIPGLPPLYDPWIDIQYNTGMQLCQKWSSFLFVRLHVSVLTRQVWGDALLGKLGIFGVLRLLLVQSQG